MTAPTEAEARADLEELVQTVCHLPGMVMNHADAYAEAVRATEREKARAIVERLVGGPADEPLREDDDMRTWCWFCFGDTCNTYSDKQYTNHTEDCPWVEARLWLARDEVPE